VRLIPLPWWQRLRLFGMREFLSYLRSSAITTKKYSTKYSAPRGNSSSTLYMTYFDSKTSARSNYFDNYSVSLASIMFINLHSDARNLSANRRQRYFRYFHQKFQRAINTFRKSTSKYRGTKKEEKAWITGTNRTRLSLDIGTIHGAWASSSEELSELWRREGG